MGQSLFKQMFPNGKENTTTHMNVHEQIFVAFSSKNYIFSISFGIIEYDLKILDEFNSVRFFL